MFYDRKGIFPAQFIGTLAKQSKIGFVVVVMFPVHKRNRVHNKVPDGFHGLRDGFYGL